MEKDSIKFRFVKGTFVARTTFEARHIPKTAKFLFDDNKKVFYTKNYLVAARLRQYADALTKKEIDRKIIHFEPWAGPLLFPTDLAPKDYQTEAAIFSLSRNRSYQGLDPGLGKTIVAALTANALAAKANPFFVYICPPFLTRNVQEEFKKWRTFESIIRRFGKEDPVEADVLIVPDSIIHKKDNREELLWFMNEARAEGRDVVLFVDEAHRFKNPEAERTRALLGYDTSAKAKDRLVHIRGYADFADRIIYMSGTPMPNRPMELYPILNHSAPETIDFMNRFDFGMKYCGGFDTGFGYDFNGGTKEDVKALAKRVRGNFMLRLRKDVLKDLPPKLEEMLIVSGDMAESVAKLERNILAQTGGSKDIMRAAMELMARQRGEIKMGDEFHLATYRRLLGIEKARYSVEAAEAVLEETSDSMLIFAFHTEVIDRLAKGLAKWKPFVITGQTPMEERHAQVKEFQGCGDARRLFILNYVAGGVGFTLTKARRVDFCEFDWVPGINQQASDRAHRIGQLADVYVRYLVFQNSLDKAVLDTHLRKSEITSEL